MRRIIERYKNESDLQLEERINLMLMGDLAQELILQRKFNYETAACDYIMNYNDFKSINIDKLFHVSVGEISSEGQHNNVTLNIKITCEQWKALYEAYSTINEWMVDIDNNCIINIQDDRQLEIQEEYCRLWIYDDDAYNQNIINERLIRHAVANDILKRNRRNKTL